jgi:RHS repeat-associated protein
MLNTGTARYAVGLDLPLGTAGHSPSLLLQYDSGQGDGPVSLGWSFGPGSISRRVDKGIPRYVDAVNGLDDDHDNVLDEPDELDLIIGPDGEELVPIQDGAYRPRIEGSFARYRRVGDGWEVDLASGGKLYFGTKAGSRVSDAAGERHFRWLLERSTDVNGNVIDYHYASHPGSTNQKYLDEIRYGPGAESWDVFYFVKLTYEDKPDWRIDYRSGFPVTTAHRLAQVDIGIQGVQPEQCAPGDWNGDETPDALISRYRLDYNDGDSHIAQLRKVTRYGSDGTNYLPPITFDYVTPSTPRTLSAENEVIGALNAPDSVMDSGLVDLIDLNRDGLPDLLKTEGYGGRHVAYRNLGASQRDNGQVIAWAGPVDNTGEQDLAWPLQLSEDHVSLSDMNGDGISDLVHTTYTNEVYYFPNQGRFHWGERQPMSVQETAPPAPHAFDAVKSTDLDFNKRMDVVQSTENGYTVWYNYRNGVYSKPVRLNGARSQGRVLQFDDSGVDFADINGDRVNDVVRITPTQIIYAAGMGHGRFAPAIAIPIPGIVLTDGNNGEVQRAKLTDINGDGLDDLVLERATSNELWFWLNLGTLAFSERYRVTGMPSQGSAGMTVRWADLNGNGTTDLVYADSDAEPRLWMIDLGELINGSAQPYLLSRIENGLGITTHIQYQSSTEQYLAAGTGGEPWVSTIPFPVAVVATVETTTGLDLDDLPGVDTYRKDFVYRDGFYEDKEKQFRGFASVDVIEHGDDSAPTRVTRHEFHTGGPDGVDNDNDGHFDEVSAENHREEDALKGLVRALELRSLSGTLFNRSENQWQVRNLLVNADGTEIRFAYQSRSDQMIYEGETEPEVLRTTFTYDDWGNVTEEHRLGALSISGDEVVFRTTYINDTDNWLIGLPARQWTSDEADTRLAETRHYYDGDAFVGQPLGQASRGRLTRQSGWVGDADYIDLVRNAYDAYGNIVTLLDPRGFRRSVAYDPDLQLFPVRESIEVGGGSPELVVDASYNPGLGVVSSSRDFNGHTTTYGHDAFGRLTSIVAPGDSEALPTQVFAYIASDPANQRVYAYDRAGGLSLTSGIVTPSAIRTHAREVSGDSGTLDTVHYVDGLGRELASVEETETGFAVSGVVAFNRMGKLRHAFVPFASDTDAFVRPPEQTPATETRYDAVGRASRVFNPPDADGVVYAAETRYLPLRTTVIDENGNAKTRHVDGLERLVRIDEENAGEVYVTRYAYDPLGNLVLITDAQDNTKTFAYDRLGRKVAMGDPDRGRMAYAYDAAGNLVRTEDAKGQVITYAFDGAGRPLNEDYHDAAGIVPDVSFHYDAASPDYPYAENLKGELAWIEDLSGAEFFSFDERGNPAWTVKRIVDDGRTQNFRTAFEYDAMDRVTAMTFPDNDRITYRYDRRGNLQSIPGILDAIAYTVAGQRESATYPNGITTRYDYDSRLRLSRLTTAHADRPDTPLQDYAYRFDGVSNILNIDDGRDVPATSPANGTQAFGYDDLYRLTRAQGTGYGRIDYRYDRIGNMTFKGSPPAPDPLHVDDALINLGAMHYGGSVGTSGRGPRLAGDAPGPHAVTGTESGLVYDYDANGNMTSHADGDVYEWDLNDRLVRVTTTDGSVSEHVYDHAGQRMVKRVTTGGESSVTYYPADSYEIRDGTAVKYVFDGTTRVARIEGRLSRPGETAVQTLQFSPGWNFFSLEVEPDDPAIESVLADIAGQYTEVWAFDGEAQEFIGFSPSGGVDDLAELHGATGYFMFVTAPEFIEVEGTFAERSIEIYADWNLIPSPIDAPMKADDFLSGLGEQCQSFWSYDGSKDEWLFFDEKSPTWLTELKIIDSGSAYWLMSETVAELDLISRSLSFRYLHSDHLGNMALITENTGMLVEAVQYFPYGLRRHELAENGEGFYSYNGKELDLGSGLMYYETRYYDPIVNKFLSVDILGNTASSSAEETASILNNPMKLNSYSYVNNSPVNYKDPTGMEGEWYAIWERPIKAHYKMLRKEILGPARQYRNEIRRVVSKVRADPAFPVDRLARLEVARIQAERGVELSAKALHGGEIATIASLDAGAKIGLLFVPGLGPASSAKAAINTTQGLAAATSLGLNIAGSGTDIAIHSAEEKNQHGKAAALKLVKLGLTVAGAKGNIKGTFDPNSGGEALLSLHGLISDAESFIKGSVSIGSSLAKKTTKRVAGKTTQYSSSQSSAADFAKRQSKSYVDNSFFRY